MIIAGVKISNARVWAGWDKGIYLKKSAARPRNGQRRAGKKERGSGGRNFCPPAAIFGEFLPAAGGGQSVNVGVFSVKGSNFFQQTPFFMTNFLWLILSYLLGVFPSGYLISRASGKDILKISWKKTSGSNVSKNIGKWQGILTGILDLFKDYLAVFGAQRFGFSQEI